MAQLAHVKPFAFTQGTFVPGGVDSCAWKTARVSEHYSDLLEIVLSSKTSRADFLDGERLAKKQAAADKAAFSTVAIPGATAYRYSIVTTSGSQPPCEPGTKPDEFGPPTCTGDPAWQTVAVEAYGRLKPNGPTAEVAIVVAGEPAVYLQGPVLVAEKILSAQIR